MAAQVQAPLPPPPQVPGQGQIQPPMQPQMQRRVVPITCGSMVYDTIEVIIQVAIRALFVAAHILIAATFLPLAWHWVALPVAAFGSAFLAAYFFPQPQFSGRGVFAPVPRGQGNVPLLPENYPIGSPMGYRNWTVVDCAFNATAHMFDSIPQLAEWFRRPLGEGMELEEFVQLLHTYAAPPGAPPGEHAPPAMIDQFREHVQNQQLPEPSVRDMFLQFLPNYQPEGPDIQQVNRLRGFFAAHDAYREFYRAHDRAIQERRAISEGDSRRLRATLSRIFPQIHPGRQQTSADEIATAVLDYMMPSEMKMRIRMTHELNMEGLPAIAVEREPQQESNGLFKIQLGNEAAPTFETLLHNNCSYANGGHLNYADEHGVQRRYPVQRTTIDFLEAPSALNFWIQRFRPVPPPDDWYNQWLGYMHQNFPRLSHYLIQRPMGWHQVKINTPIEFPEELTISVNGEDRVYRLGSFVTHKGIDNRGHYVAGRIRNGEKFYLNDSISTWIQTQAHQENWNEQLKHAYIVCYLPVDPSE